MKKWKKIKCAYFKNLSFKDGVLEIINPDTGKVSYRNIPVNKAFENVSKVPKYVSIYFDSSFNIKRIIKYRSIKLSKSEIDSLIKKLD